jgi:hypothetical protein
VVSICTVCFNINETCSLPTEGTYWRRMILTINSINQLIFVMGTRCVFLGVGIECLNIIKINFWLHRVSVFGHLPKLRRVENQYNFSVMNWKGRGRKRSWPVLGTVLLFACWD